MYGEQTSVAKAVSLPGSGWFLIRLWKCQPKSPSRTPRGHCSISLPEELQGTLKHCKRSFKGLFLFLSKILGKLLRSRYYELSQNHECGRSLWPRSARGKFVIFSLGCRFWRFHTDVGHVAHLAIRKYATTECSMQFVAGKVDVELNGLLYGRDLYQKKFVEHIEGVIDDALAVSSVSVKSKEVTFLLLNGARSPCRESDWMRWIVNFRPQRRKTTPKR